MFPILAAFDVGGPFRQEDINGPPWIAGAAGTAFVMAGLAVAVGERMRWLGGAAGFVAFLALVAIGHWIAFGVGEREGTSTVSGFIGSRSREAGNVECRVAFGMGALLLLAATGGKALVESFREYRQTGRWPRNEEFIARVKARRGAKREAKRRESDQSTNSSAGHSRQPRSACTNSAPRWPSITR